MKILHSARKRSAFERLSRVWAWEKKEIGAIAFYSIAVSLLSLSVPVAVQSLVNSVAFGELTQQLIILSIVVFLVLSFSGILSLIQFYSAELLQRRLFARYALDLAVKVPKICNQGNGSRRGPEFLKPFLEIVTVHKSLSELLLGGLGIVLQFAVSVVLLAVYHPLLMGFALLLCTAVGALFAFLGGRAVATSDSECTQKYEVLGWLEDLLRTPLSFQSKVGAEFGLNKADAEVLKWVSARQDHFSILLKKNVVIFAIHAIGSAALLGLGGYLVIVGQLTLGQLVAAELVVNTALYNLSRFGKQIETFFDLTAAMNKLEGVLDIPLEREGPVELPLENATPSDLIIRDLHACSAVGGHKVLTGLNLTLQAGERLAIYGPGAAGKSLLIDCILGLAPYSGRIVLDGHDTADLRKQSIRTRIAQVGDYRFFHGTLEENITLGSSEISLREVRELLDRVNLGKKVSELPDGLQTELSPNSTLFSFGEFYRLWLVRAALTKPGLLILDQTIDRLDQESLRATFNFVLDARRKWTLLVATSQAERALLLPKAYFLQGGVLVDLMMDTKQSPSEGGGISSEIRVN